MTKDHNPNALAPSIAPQWRNDFVIELRLQGAAGTAIADALMEVEAHCSESGQQALNTFGPAVDYARSLDLPDQSGWTRARLVQTWVSMLLAVGGVSLVLLGGLALAQGREAEIGADDLISGGMTIAAMVLVFVLGEHLLRFLVEHPVWSAVGFALAITIVVLVGLPFRDIRLGSMPAVLPLATGLAAMVTFVVFTTVLRRAGKGLQDPLLPPPVPARLGDDG